MAALHSDHYPTQGLTVFLKLTVDDSAAVCVPVCGVVDGPLPQLPRLLHAHIVLVLAVKDSVGIRRPRANAEDVMGQPSAISVHVV